MDEVFERVRILQQLGKTYRAFLSAYEQEVGHCLPRWRVMLYLYNAAGPSSQKVVAEAAFVDMGALSRQLNALEALGWITRDTDRDDKRITNVALTAQGRREVEASLPKREAFIKATLGDISDRQLQQLMDALLLLEHRFGAFKPAARQEKAAA